MFAFIEGRVQIISENLIAVLCNGVGYEVNVSKKLVGIKRLILKVQLYSKEKILEA